MAYLLDSNVVLRLFNDDDPHHAETQDAVDALRARGETLHIAPQNAAEAWNVATRPLDKNGFGYTVAEADALLSLAERVAPVLPDHPDTGVGWCGRWASPACRSTTPGSWPGWWPTA